MVVAFILYFLFSVWIFIKKATCGYFFGPFLALFVVSNCLSNSALHNCRSRWLNPLSCNIWDEPIFQDKVYLIFSDQHPHSSWVGYLRLSWHWTQWWQQSSNENQVCIRLFFGWLRRNFLQSTSYSVKFLGWIYWPHWCWLLLCFWPGILVFKRSTIPILKDIILALSFFTVSRFVLDYLLLH